VEGAKRTDGGTIDPLFVSLLSTTSWCCCKQAVLSFNMKSDLSSCFSWNTKQLFAYIKVVYETDKHVRNEVTVWDKVIKTTEDHKVVDEVFLSKYKLVDNGAGLRGRDVNVTLAWNVMPYIGTISLTSSSLVPSVAVNAKSLQKYTSLLSSQGRCTTRKRRSRQSCLQTTWWILRLPRGSHEAPTKGSRGTAPLVTNDKFRATVPFTSFFPRL